MRHAAGTAPWRGPPDAAVRPQGGLVLPWAAIADVLFGLAILLLLTVSPNVLFRLGIPYEATGGNPLGKFHPATLVSVCALFLYLMQAGPDRALGHLVARRPGLALLAALWGFAVVYVAAVVSVPVTPLIETFLLPLLLFGCVAVRRDVPQAIPRLIHGAFAANALIGLGEFVSGWRLTPLMAGTVEITGDWRSSALLGHPLTNATLTACYITIVLLGARGLKAQWRIPMIGLQLGGLAVFGGRTALVLTLALLGIACLIRTLRFLGGMRVRLVDLAIVALGIPLVLIAAAGLGETGFFDLLIRRFIADDGSAQTRIIMFRLFEGLSTGAVLLGPDPALIATLVQREGLEFGIESFPVAFVLLYGAIVSAMLLAGLAALFTDLVRATRPAAALVLLLFFILAATSLSLAGKSTMLGAITIMILALMTPVRLQPTRKPAP